MKEKNGLPVEEGKRHVPALFAPIHKEWILQAMDELSAGAVKRFFSTGSRAVAPAKDANICSIYFKIKCENFISAKADFIEITEHNPREFRIRGNENILGKYYYGFRNLRWLKDKRDLVSLKRHGSEAALRNDVPGACMIVDPQIE